MSLAITSRSDIARELMLGGSDGRPPERGLAQLIREYLHRRGLSPRAAVLRYAREQVDAAGLRDGLPASAVSAVLDRLVAFGDCQEVAISSQRYIAPAPPRWLSTGSDSASFLGVASPPASIVQHASDRPGDLVRRLRITSDDDIAALQLAGVSQTTLEDWLLPLHYVRHAARRTGKPLRDDSMTLRHFWEVLVRSLEVEGQQLSEEAEVRVLAGERGSYFGRYNALEVEGRWSTSVDEGTWCAYRKGYGEAHWHPILLSIMGSERRCIDLHDADEWSWAVLARARADGQDEVVRSAALAVSFTFPMPSQLRAGMDLLGQRSAPWSWTVAAGAPDVWGMLR